MRPPSSSVVREVNWVETGSGLLTRMFRHVVDGVLVSSYSRADEVALDAVPTGVAAEAPDDRLLHLQDPARLERVGDAEGVDLVLGGGLGRRRDGDGADQGQRQGGQHRQQPAQGAGEDGDARTCGPGAQPRSPRLRAASARSASRLPSRSARVWRLSYSRLPVATAISTLA